MSKVFVIDTKKQPLNPVHPGWARLLLKEGKAAVYRRYPFTLILKNDIPEPQVQPLRLKLDPGSKTTGIATVNDASGEVVFAAELTHRGQAIRESLQSRRASRRSRRARKTRYRKPRFHNRRRKQGWLPPSLMSRIAHVLTWVTRLRKVAPITALSQEVVRFDLHQLEKPEIMGIEYQHRTLFGYETREYLLEKWGRACSYCGTTDRPLQIEHIHPRARGGTDRISNLCLACAACNTAKGTQDIAVFLKKDPERLKRIQAQAKHLLKDAAAVNTTRWALYERLKHTGVEVETGTGGMTKYHRTMRGLPKTHWCDAANVGKSTPNVLQVEGVVPLLIKAQGHGRRQCCLMDRFGFPRTKGKGAPSVKGFRTGDIVKASVTTGKKTGTYIGRIAVRASGFFNVTTATRTVQGISHRDCCVLHRADGYSYAKGVRHSSHA